MYIELSSSPAPRTDAPPRGPRSENGERLLSLEIIPGPSAESAGSRRGTFLGHEIRSTPGNMMNRHFLVMAVMGGSLLVADFVIGLFATGEKHGPGAVARGVH